MSQLNNWNVEADYYPEEAVIDIDGNTRTRASKTPIRLKIWVQPTGQSGTSARRAERDLEGFMTEEVLRLRLRREDEKKYDPQPQAKFVIEGEEWSVFGNAKRFRGSPRTEHREYNLRRA